MGLFVGKFRMVRHNGEVITNGEYFKTPEERAKAHMDWCIKHRAECEIRQRQMKEGPNCDVCRYAWLDKSVEVEPLECPICGGETELESHSEGHNVRCKNHYCYVCKTFESREEAILTHNRLVEAVKRGLKDNV